MDGISSQRGELSPPSGPVANDAPSSQREETVSCTLCVMLMGADGEIRYNPVLGEFFRCSYNYSDGTEGFYVAEQVSHHPVSGRFS